jgi:hypothetical protein
MLDAPASPARKLFIYFHLNRMGSDSRTSLVRVSSFGVRPKYS